MQKPDLAPTVNIDHPLVGNSSENHISQGAGQVCLCQGSFTPNDIDVYLEVRPGELTESDFPVDDLAQPEFIADVIYRKSSKWCSGPIGAVYDEEECDMGSCDANRPDVKIDSRPINTIAVVAARVVNGSVVEHSGVKTRQFSGKCVDSCGSCPSP